MIKQLSDEKWKHFQFPGSKRLRNKYALSSKGRIASYKNDILDGKLLQGSITTVYRTLNVHRLGYNGTLYIHREIARLFLRKPSAQRKYVIHLNHNKLDNSVKNLKWVSFEEMTEHSQHSPAKIAYKKVQANRTVGQKLNARQVKSIKRVLNDKNRKITIKKLAEKYSVSEMAMYRIKSGENWGRIKNPQQ